MRASAIGREIFGGRTPPRSTAAGRDGWRRRLRLALAVLAAALVAPAGVAADDGQLGEEIGVVEAATGAATLDRAGSLLAVAAGQPLLAGDEILTGPDGAVGFSLTDGSRYSIGPNSAIVVTDFDFLPDRGVLARIARFIYGAMARDADGYGRPAPEPARIGAPAGTAGARDARFAVGPPDGGGGR